MIHHLILKTKYLSKDIQEKERILTSTAASWHFTLKIVIKKLLQFQKFNFIILFWTQFQY
eukprot:403333796